MRVKVCPKCKAENKATNNACSNCYTSLECVIPSESAKPADPVLQSTSAGTGQPRPVASSTPRPPAPNRTVGAPAQTQYGQPAPLPPGMPQQTQYGQPGMPPQPPMGQTMVPPTKPNSIAGIAIAFIVILVIGIAAGGYVIWSRVGPKNVKPTISADKTVMAFLEAKKTGKFEAVQPYLSRNTLALIDAVADNRQMQSAGFNRKDAEKNYVWDLTPSADEMRNKVVAASIVKGDKDADENTAIVHIIVEKPKQAPQQQAPTMPPLPGQQPAPPPEQKVDVSSLFDFGPIEVEYVMVAEDGRWKVDVHETMRRSIGLHKIKSPFPGMKF